MNESAQPPLYPSLPPPAVDGPLTMFSGRMAALAIGIGAAAVAASFICAPWSGALVGALAILGLSAVESEPFLLLVIFLMPVGWVLSADVPLRYVPVAARWLVVVGFFLGRLLRGRIDAKGLLRPSLARASLLFLGAILASAVLGREAWTRESARSIYSLASYVGFFFLVLAWADSQQRIRKVLGVLLCSTLLAAGFAIFQEIVGGYTSLWLYLNPPDQYFGPWEWRATSLLNYSNSLAGYLNLILPFALAYCVVGERKWKKLCAWTVGVGFVALLCTQSLGGLVAFCCVLVLAIFCFVRSRRNRLLLFCGIFTLTFGFYIAREALNPAHMGASAGQDAAARLLLWGTAWDFFVHSPIVGIGWGNFVTLYGSYLNFSWILPGILDVHNLYLQLLTETGILGFAAFFSLMFLAGREARRQWRAARSDLGRALSFGVLGAILTVLVHGSVDFLFRVSPQFGTLFWTLLALLVANASPRVLENRRAPSPQEARHSRELGLGT